MTAKSMRSKSGVGVAVFSDRGIGYKDYNEDVAIAGVGPVPYAGVCDQAGGMGNVKGRPGLASTAAAKALEDAVWKIGEGLDPIRALYDAAYAAHASIQEINQLYSTDCITTLVGGVIVNGVATVVNVGDSQALLIGRDGTVKFKSIPHSISDLAVAETGDPNASLRDAHVIYRSVGGPEPVDPDVFQWPVEPGDTLILLSDGILDANLVAQMDALKRGQPWRATGTELTHLQVGLMVAGEPTPEAATNAVVRYARHQVMAGMGKPDNLGIAMIRAPG